MKKAFILIILAVLTQNLPPQDRGSLNEPIPAYKGSGLIYDIKTGGQISLNENQLINVLIIAEGYTKTEIDNKIFDEDVKSWIREAEIVEPFKSYKEAFNVWQYNAVSKENIFKDNNKKNDTALSISVKSSGDVSDDFKEASKRVWNIVEKSELIKDDYYPPEGLTNCINKNLIIVILIYNPQIKKSGYSGLSRRFANPADKNEILSAAIAHNRPHEFLHAFAKLDDEYLAVKPVKKPVPNDRSELSAGLSNVVKDADYGTVPWKHLLSGGVINPDCKNLTGIYGNELNGYHSEAKCLMNGTHENAKFYGGSGNLRVTNRLCNWCREIVIFRLYERIHIFNNPAADFEIWKNQYRADFYIKFGFIVPKVVPQVNSDGQIIPSVSR